jgi:hypothetical protein
MQAQKLILPTNAQGQLLGLPIFPPNVHLELIVLFPEVINKTPSKRRPAPGLAGKVKILGEVIAPVISEDEWDALK